MDTWESAEAPARQLEQVEAVCWECGELRQCFEYIGCCTGTTFHVCENCEERIRGNDEPAACPTSPSL